MILSIKLENLIQTNTFATNIAKVLPHKITIVFNGDLGAGKTTLIKNIIQSYGVSGNIKSPTYTLVETYHTPISIIIHHFDLYRFHDENEWLDAGFDEYFTQTNTICLIEWPIRAMRLIPEIDWVVDIHILNSENLINNTNQEQERHMDYHPSRMVTITPHTPIGHECIRKLKSIMKC